MHSLGKKGKNLGYANYCESIIFLCMQKLSPHCTININKYLEPIRTKKTQCIEPWELQIIIFSI